MFPVAERDELEAILMKRKRRSKPNLAHLLLEKRDCVKGTFRSSSAAELRQSAQKLCQRSVSTVAYFAGLQFAI
jgi:hypothetical protein